MKLGLTVLIAESELQHVPEYANRIYVIERGEMRSAAASTRRAAMPRCAGSLVKTL